MQEAKKMKFTINKAKAYNALGIVSRAISPNSPTPALAGIKIDADDNKVVFTGSDSTMSIQITLSGEDERLNIAVQDPGTIVADAKYLLEIFKKFETDTVTVELLDGTLTHFCDGKSQFKLNGYRPSDYPKISFENLDISFMVKYEDLVDMIGKVAFACAFKETRPVLTGVNFISDGEKIVCAATDSFRLAQIVLPIKADKFNVTVPAKALNELKNVFKPGDAITVSVSNREMMFCSENKIMKTTLLNGAYPEVQKLIPIDFKYHMTADRRVLLSGIDRASFLKQDGISIVRFEIKPGQDVILSSRSLEIGDFTERISAVVEGEDGMKVSFIGSYLADALKALESDKVRISFNEPVKPFILANEGSEEKDLIELVLPIRTFN